MPVLKTTSPSESTWAPNDSPWNLVPSERINWAIFRLARRSSQSEVGGSVLRRTKARKKPGGNLRCSRGYRLLHSTFLAKEIVDFVRAVPKKRNVVDSTNNRPFFNGIRDKRTRSKTK